MSTLQRLAPRMAGLILIAGGFCISVMHAYLFGRAKGEMSAGSSPDFLRLLHSARHNAAIAFVGGIVIFALDHVASIQKFERACETTARKFSGIEP